MNLIKDHLIKDWYEQGELRNIQLLIERSFIYFVQFSIEFVEINRMVFHWIYES